jgi:outer membrane biosynthesis protein TonB
MSHVVRALLLLQLAGAGLFLESARPPVPPPNTVGGGVVVVTATVDPSGRLQNPRILSGALPFSVAAMESVGGFQFRNNLRREVPVSVTFLFRSRTTIADQPTVIRAAASVGAGESPAVPEFVVDPGYPAQSLAEGVVVLQAEINAAGIPQKVHAVRSAPGLSDFAARAVRQWKFQPSGQPGDLTPRTAIAVISFLRPVVP